MLMGRPPFSGRKASAILEKHVHEAPRPIRDVNPTIPKEFADAIMRCLEKDPWKRFQTAKDLDGALQAVTFRGTREHTVLREDASRVHRTIVLLIAGLVLIAGVLAGLAIG